MPSDRRASSPDRTASPGDLRATRAQLFAVLSVVFAFAFAVRLIYFDQIRELGFFWNTVSDATVYQQASRDIAAGDWLAPRDFVHAPLYAYFWAMLRQLGAEALPGVRLAQLALGAATCALVAGMAVRLFGFGAGLLAGVMLALYPPAMFFDGLIQKTSLALLLAAATLFLLLLDVTAKTQRGGWLRAGLLGLALGLLVLTRQNALVLVPLVLAGMWLTPRTRARRLLDSAVFVLLFAATLAPWAIRNRVVLGTFVIATPNAGQNFAMGNHADATGTYLPMERGRANGLEEQRAWTRAAEQALGRELSPTEVSAYYRDAALKWIRANPGAWLRLMGRKWLMTWGVYEPYDSEDYYLYQQHAELLRNADTFWNFGVLTPLAGIGIVLTRRRWRELWPLYGWLLLNALAIVLFVVFARYRMILVPALIVLAAAGVVEIFTIRLGELRRIALALGVGGGLAVLCNGPWVHARTPEPTSYLNHAVALAEGRRLDEAVAETNQALALDSHNLDATQMLGTLRLDQHRNDEALAAFDAVRQAEPTYAAAWRGVGDALLAMGRTDEAIEYYQKALVRDDQDARAMAALGAAMTQRGAAPAALPWLDRAVALAPELPQAWLNRANVLFALGRFVDAQADYEHVLKMRPNDIDARHNLGVLLMTRGETGRAIELLRATLKDNPDHPLAPLNLADALATENRYDAALQVLDEAIERNPDRAEFVADRDRIARLAGR